MARRKGWNWCPKCAKALVEKLVEEEAYLACSDQACDFIDWNNPIPVVAALVLHEEGVVLVKRGVQPFIGKWCLPRGFLKTDENPKGAMVREAEEECGFRLCLKRMLNACNPSPKHFPLNQLTMFYLAIVASGTMVAGSDAQDVGIFKPDALPELCFGTDKQIISDWFAGVHGTLEGPVNYRPPSSLSP